MLHSPRNPSYPHRQLLACNSPARACIIPNMAPAAFQTATLHIWLHLDEPSNVYRHTHYRPTYVFEDPYNPASPFNPITNIPPRTIPKTMHEIVLLFINADPTDPYCGHPFVKSLDIKSLTTHKLPSAISEFYAFCISPLNLFNEYQKTILRKTAILVGCPHDQAHLIPFQNPTTPEQSNLLDLENKAAPSIPNLLPFGKAIRGYDETAKRNRKSQSKNACPLPDKLFAAYTARRFGAGEHNLPNGHNPKQALSGGWPNPTSMLAYERAFMAAAQEENHPGVPLPPITPDRQARHNADALIYANLPTRIEDLQQSLATISTYINHPSTAAHEDPNTPPQYRTPKDHPNYITNHLTERTISNLVEAIARVSDHKG